MYENILTPQTNNNPLTRNTIVVPRHSFLVIRSSSFVIRPSSLSFRPFPFVVKAGIEQYFFLVQVF